MPTVSKGLADVIVKRDGYYSNDPRVTRIVEYTNMAGLQAFGLEYEHELGEYTESVYVRNPKVYWEAKHEAV